MSDIESLFSAQELNEIQKAVSNEKFKMNWILICEGLKHEMYPKLSNTIRSMVITEEEKSNNHNKIYLHDIDTNNINKVINYLKKQRKLAIEERIYLRNFIKRAMQFIPITSDNKS